MGSSAADVGPRPAGALFALLDLPGSFGGVHLGAGGPLDAGTAHRLVLVGLPAEVLVAWAVTELVARGELLDPVPR